MYILWPFLCMITYRLQERWMKIVLWQWQVLTLQRSTTCTLAKVVSYLELMLMWWFGIQMQQGPYCSYIYKTGYLEQNKLAGIIICAGRSLWALRCRVETSISTRGCAVTVSLWSQSAEDVWCVRTVCSCVLRVPGSSTHSALSPTISIRKWCREKRYIHIQCPHFSNLI